jgi:vacuolar-type H+-ATPase subunit D/Vma8
MSTAAATGRAGRLRLRRQLIVAARASELLDRKKRILAGELGRLELLASRTGTQWDLAARQAAIWLHRSAALDGQRGLAAATPQSGAILSVAFDSAMGVRYPVHATVSVPDDATRAGSSALAMATQTHRRALEAACRHAATTRAVALLAAELAHTRARQRAIDNRWIPRLHDALGRLESQLDELDREENLRLHWAAGKSTGGDRS